MLFPGVQATRIELIKTLQALTEGKVRGPGVLRRPSRRVLAQPVVLPAPA